MQYEYQLRQSEMRRIEKLIEDQDPATRESFWGVLIAIGGMAILQVGKYVEDKLDFRDALIAALATIAFVVVRFTYITVRRLRKVRRAWGTVLHAVSCRMEFQQYWFASAGPPECEHKRSWREVELIERPDFLFLIKRDQHTYLLPTRVVPPDELPRLVAFIRERVEAFREPPPPDDVAPTGD